MLPRVPSLRYRSKTLPWAGGKLRLQRALIALPYGEGWVDLLRQAIVDVALYFLAVHVLPDEHKLLHAVAILIVPVAL
jgi:hypothetical protein